jgi:hypothetical protein
MKIVPPGTVDPTPFLFNTTMYTLSCMLGVALICNMLIRPVNPKYFEKIESASIKDTIKVEVKDGIKEISSKINSGSKPMNE